MINTKESIYPRDDIRDYFFSYDNV
jgi:hypothetical protein